MYEGQKLIGAVTSHGVLNGVIYSVVKVADKVLLSEGDREITITKEILATSLRLCHSITIFSSQSRTLEGVVRICTGNAPGIVHPCFTRNLLLVACSRATSIEKLRIE